MYMHGVCVRVRVCVCACVCACACVRVCVLEGEKITHTHHPHLSPLPCLPLAQHSGKGKSSTRHCKSDLEIPRILRIKQSHARGGADVPFSLLGRIENFLPSSKMQHRMLSS